MKRLNNSLTFQLYFWLLEILLDILSTISHGQTSEQKVRLISPQFLSLVFCQGVKHFPEC